MIITASDNGLFKRDVTVFANQLFIQVLLIVLSASSGFNGSSIINRLAPFPVIDQPVPVA